MYLTPQPEGSQSFKCPSNPKPNDMVTCNGCGASSRYAEVQAAAVKKATEFAEKTVRDALKKAGFK